MRAYVRRADRVHAVRWRGLPIERARAVLGVMRDDIALLRNDAAGDRMNGNEAAAASTEQYVDDLRAAHNALAALAGIDEAV